MKTNNAAAAAPLAQFRADVISGLSRPQKMLSARWLKVNPHGKDKHSSKNSRVFHAIDQFCTRLL